MDVVHRELSGRAVGDPARDPGEHVPDGRRSATRRRPAFDLIGGGGHAEQEAGR